MNITISAATIANEPQYSFSFEWTDDRGFVSPKDPNQPPTPSFITYNIGAASTISTDSWQQPPDLGRRLKKIEERLAILNIDEITDLKMLREAYNRYKMIEGLLGKGNENE